MFTRILVPTDFSEPSDAALDYARALAERFGATLRLLHVIDPAFTAQAVTSEAYLGTSPGIYEMLVQEAQSRFGERVFPADRARFGAKTEVITGPVAATIRDYAADQHIDLIVMGTPGRTGLAHLLMGSVAEHVGRAAAGPVLTVRQAAVAETVSVSRSARISQLDTVPGRG